MSIEERIIQSAAEAIIVAYASGKITLWNAGAERLFGFSAAETLNQTLDIIIPEVHQKQHWDGYRQVMRSGLIKYGTQLLRVPAIRKDCSRFSVAFTVGLLKNAAGSVEGIFAIMRDDSERWETERTLRKRIAQIEETISLGICHDTQRSQRESTATITPNPAEPEPNRIKKKYDARHEHRTINKPSFETDCWNHLLV